MMVCICKGVNDKQILSASKKGCCSVRALRCELGVGKQCGKCIKEAHSLLKTTVALAQAARL